MTYPEMKVIYEDNALVKIDVPYCPGFLAFKEVPHFVDLYDKMKKERPDIKIGVVLVDGNGILHCNQCGCASHLGVLLDLPTIGCSKNIFAVDGINQSMIEGIKQDFWESSRKKGYYVPLVGRSGKVWGAALKSGPDSNDPLIVSVGHRLSISSAVEIVNTCCRTRIAEPIRYADKKSRHLISGYNLGSGCRGKERTKAMHKIEEKKSLAKTNTPLEQIQGVDDRDEQSEGSEESYDEG